MASHPHSTHNSEEGTNTIEDLIAIRLTGDCKAAERFRSCNKNDFPMCLDEALDFIFGTSREEIMKTLAESGKNKSSVIISSPNDIHDLYIRVIREFQVEMKDQEGKVIESASEKKLTLKHCGVCPLYESELSRFRYSYT